MPVDDIKYLFHLKYHTNRLKCLFQPLKTLFNRRTLLRMDRSLMLYPFLAHIVATICKNTMESVFDWPYGQCLISTFLKLKISQL